MKQEEQLRDKGFLIQQASLIQQVHVLKCECVESLHESVTISFVSFNWSFRESLCLQRSARVSYCVFTQVGNSEFVFTQICASLSSFTGL